jgi:antitoxin YefM
MISADELAGLEETAHLLASPANAERLLRALEASRKGEPGISTIMDELIDKMGLNNEGAGSCH